MNTLLPGILTIGMLIIATTIRVEISISFNFNIDGLIILIILSLIEYNVITKKVWAIISNKIKASI